MVKEDSLKNQYILMKYVDRESTEKSNLVVAKLGNIQREEMYAGYVVELEDWAQSFEGNDTPLKQLRTMNNVTTALLTYSGAAIARVISEDEFYTNVFSCIVKRLTEVQDQEAWSYTFKINPDRRALIRYLRDNTKSGLVLI